MLKRFMLFIAAICITTLVAQANRELEKREFTVTQIALDAAKAAEEATDQATEGDTNETHPEGGATEEK